MSERCPGSVYRLTGRNARLIVYEDKVVIERIGFLNKLNYGFSGDKTILMQSISSIQYKAGGGILNGFLQFGIIGGNERQGGVSRAVSDENSIVFTKDKNEKAETIKAYIEDKIAERSKPISTVNQSSVADEIRKLKSLLDDGIITEEEYNAKKKQLLA